MPPATGVRHAASRTAGVRSRRAAAGLAALLRSALLQVLARLQRLLLGICQRQVLAVLQTRVELLPHLGVLLPAGMPAGSMGQQSDMACQAER